MPMMCAGLEYPGERRIYQKQDGNPFIERDLEKCILCGKCVKVCDEVQGVEAIDVGYRGFKSKICTNYEEDLNCEFCGQCVSVCPTGALTPKQSAKKGRYQDIRKVDTVCAYCGTGCNITAHVKDNEIIKITSRPDTWNEGWLCVKGTVRIQVREQPGPAHKAAYQARGPVRGSDLGRGLCLCRRTAEGDPGQARR